MTKDQPRGRKTESEQPRSRISSRVRTGRGSREAAAGTRGRSTGRTLHIFVNSTARQFKRRAFDGVVRKLRTADTAVELHDAPSATALLQAAKQIATELSAAGKKSIVFVAAGGDGTVNLVARAALDADLPLGILPYGKENNIARALYGSVQPDEVSRTFGGGLARIDPLLAGDQLFLSAAGLGLLPALHGHVEKKGAPRFGIGWGMLSTELYKKQSQLTLTLKLDGHRLNIATRILSIHLLPFAAGLNLSPMSQPGDAHFEVIIEQPGKSERAAAYLRDAAARQLQFGRGLAAYRCAKLILQPVRQMPFYLDGEVIPLPSDILEVTHADKQLQVIGAS